MLDTQTCQIGVSQYIVTLGKKRLVTNKTFGFFLDFLHEKRPPILYKKNECTRLRIVRWWNSHCHAWQNPPPQKVSGRLKVGTYFPVYMHRRPRRKKLPHFLRREKNIFSHHRRLTGRRDGQIISFFPPPPSLSLLPLFFMTESSLHGLVWYRWISSLCKLFGTIHSLRIKSRDVFPVDVSRPPRWKKV